MLRRERAVAKRELSAEVKRLSIELTSLDETIAELRRAIDKGSGTGVILDLPVARRN